MRHLALFDRFREGWAVVVFSLILTVLATPSSARADEHAWDDDAQPQAGDIAPLEALLARVRDEFDGRILEVEIEQEWRRGGRIWIYEAKVLTLKGHVLKLEYDAKSLELLELKGRRERHRRRGDDE